MLAFLKIKIYIYSIAKEYFSIFTIIATLLSSFSILILTTSSITDNIKANATANCPSGYSWNGTQCEQYIAKDSVYSCPSGSSIDINNCKTTILDKVGLNHLVFLTPNTQGPTYNTCPTGTITSSTIRTIGQNYVSDGTGASTTWNYKICIASTIFNYIKVISGSSVNSSSACTSPLINIGVTSNAVPSSNSVTALCVPPNNSSAIVLGNGSCPGGYTDRGLTPSANLCLSNTNLFSFPANMTSSCPSGYTDTVNGTGTPCVSYTSALSFSCLPTQYLSNQATDSCIPCVAGSYCPGGVAAVAVGCDPGNYCLAAVSSQTQCPGGSYCPSVSQAPISCSAGNYCPSMAITQTQCTVNNYCKASVSSPTPCPANYNSPTGSSSLSACTPNTTILSVKAYLSGAYKNSTVGLNNSLRTRGLLPFSQPFNVSPFNYSGGEALPNNLYQNICDWMLLQIKDPVTDAVVYSKAVILGSDGNLLDASNLSQVTGNLSNISIPALPGGNYKVTLRHRNHLGLSTDTPVLFAPGQTTTIDFSTGVNIKGNTTINNVNTINSTILGIVGPVNTPYNPLATPGTTGSYIYGLKQADANSDGAIDASDRNILNTSDEFDGVYNSKDLNLDGVIDATDRNASQNAVEAVQNL